jgi:hypothetical protein
MRKDIATALSGRNGPSHISSGGAAAGAGAGSEFGNPDPDCLAILALASRLHGRQRLRLVRRTGRAKTFFSEVIRVRGAAQVDFGGILFGLSEEKVASAEVGVNFESRFALVGRRMRFRNHGGWLVRESR